MEVTGYLALVAVGVVLGLTGGGGSMLSVPILVYIFSLDVVLATGYSFFMVGTSSLVGTAFKQKDRLLNVRAALLFGVPSLSATFLTRKWIIPALPPELFAETWFEIGKTDFFLCVFAFLIVVSGVMVLMNFGTIKSGGASTSWMIIVAGFITGILSGMAGIGGGVLIMPVLLIFCNMPFRTAAGTALVIVSLNSLSGFLGDAFTYVIDWYFLLSITSLAVLGMVIGNFSNHFLPAHLLKRCVAWVTIALGLIILWKELF